MSSMTPTNDKEREKLPAEVTFNKRVYGGISYAAQALAGSGLTYWIKHAGGRPYYDKMANWVGPNFISKISKKRGAAAIASADWWITVTTMVAVGTAFVIPVKWLEDKKLDFVKRWTQQDNDARTASGDAPAKEELEHQQKLIGQLEAEPKQGWWSLMIARFASLVPVYGTLYALGPINQKMEGGTQAATKWIVQKAGFRKAAQSEALKNASGIAFYDGFYSMISAGGLFVFSRYIAPMFCKPGRDAECTPPAQEAIPQQAAGATGDQPKATLNVKPRTAGFAENYMMQKTAEPSYSMAL